MDSGIKDIVERETVETEIKAPQAPKADPSKLLNKKWQPRRRPLVLDPHATQQEIANASRTSNTSSAGHSTQPKQTNSPADAPLSEPERIHLENIRKIQRMSSEEIEKEREEIFRSMDPAILESLLKRATLKEEQTKKQQPQSNSPSKPELKEPRTPVYGEAAPPKGSIADWDPAPQTIKPGSIKPESKKAAPTNNAPNPVEPVLGPHDDHTGMHFPQTPDDLRQYFPDLPVETEKLAWMQPISEAEEAEYSSELRSVAPSELRFDFRGDLMTPRQSRSIDTSAGLHHHGDAPSAAGYTLPELAHLARSSHPAQRAMAIQTAGRVLHKIRTRKFARSSDIQEGLTALIHTTRIMDTLVEAADEKTRSLTVRSLATEALWLANTDNDTSKESVKAGEEDKTSTEK